MPHKIRLILGTLALTAGLAACGQKAVRIDHDPGQREQALASARQFLQGVADSNPTKVREVVGVPFWADGDKFFTVEEFMQGLTKEMGTKPPRHLEIIEMQLFKTSDIRLIDDDIYENLEEANMHKDTYLAAAEVSIDNDRETVFILLKPDEKGSWKVVGVED